ncbi:Germin-like protein 9-1 [Bienertia sinuspersici]
MENKTDYISDINPSKDSWRIVVKVIRLWHVPSYIDPSEVQSIEMVLIDEKGDKIQVSLKRAMIKKFRSLLNEGVSYTMSTFGVGQNIGDYKPTSHAYKLNFFDSTQVNVTMDANTLNYDVIGYVSGVTGTGDYMRNGKTEKKMIIQLEDL